MTLPESTQVTIARLDAFHELRVSDRTALYVNSFVSVFVDRRTETRLPKDEAKALLQKLFSHAVQPERILRHQWQVGDLVIFDDVGTIEIHRRELRGLPARMF